MASNLVTLFNQAVTAVGGRGVIADPAERSREADLCRVWYDTVRDNVLKAASWPSTKNDVQLAVLAERTGDIWVPSDPAPGWRFAYAVPNDMIAPRFLHSHASFELGLHSGANAIFTNQENAILRYTLRQEDLARWDIGLYTAVMSALAANISMPFNAKVGISDRMQQKATEAILIAATDIANEQETQYSMIAEQHAVRGFTQRPVITQFFYPYEQLNGVAP